MCRETLKAERQNVSLVQLRGKKKKGDRRRNFKEEKDQGRARGARGHDYVETSNRKAVQAGTGKEKERVAEKRLLRDCG